ncbi:MAG: hypothetical protein Q4D98_09220, partial [Planctomycetia bacterium]|nr:hypothetical protein [Planctomycetia bacterium]
MKNLHSKYWGIGKYWAVLALGLMLGGGFCTPQAWAEVTLVNDATYGWLLSGSGTYSSEINLGTDQLTVNATKLGTDSTNKVLTNNITAGMYLQNDLI